MNDNYILVYDFETTHYLPELAEPVELAAVVLHPRRLEAVDGGKFHAIIQPPNIEEVSNDNIEFHANARKVGKDDIIKMWKDAPSQKEVWKQFSDWLLRFHKPTKKKSMFSAPIRAGQNIINFDNVIWQRLCERYKMVDKDGKQNLAFARDNIDLLNILWMWFENTEELKSFSMDNLRQYFGISNDKGHTALVDVEQTCALIVRYIKLHRNLLERNNIKFRGSFINAKA